MSLLSSRTRFNSWWSWIVQRWNVTPGYVKWIGGLLLGALLRFLGEKLFPEIWSSISHRLFDPTMPVWLAVVAVIAVLMLERAVPSVYRRMRSTEADAEMYPLFGVRWATPPEVEHVQGPYCAACAAPLRGALWSGDFSPTLWVCPACKREYTTPEFPDIRREVERRLTGTR